MKKIQAFVHHIRSPSVLDALRDAGVKNVTLLDVKGTLKPLSESEQAYSVETRLAIISEVRISLVCDDADVKRITDVTRSSGHIWDGISGWVYVSPVEQALPIEGSDC